ncbi:uncharacterized protein LOC126719454 [Quercus robur]|uniref:uncharacterized protein LOC126719454 n=1 Tax=Quercus robur TaxID=38942 RepID=UPI00216286F2|nr:uncharacterized protein LOC126719454 [Quercus robur]
MRKASDEPTLPSGKSDKVSLRSSVERFLSDFFLSLSRARLVVLGEGGWDSCANFRPKAVLELDQSSLAVIPMKAMCVVPGAGVLVEEELDISDMGLGGEDSLSIPLMSITPFGLPLSAELNCGNEAVECIEREMEAAKVLNRKVTVARKAVIYKDKEKRELRNLQSLETKEWRPFVEGLEFDLIDGSERGWLERRLEKEEILLAINELVGDKALRPNGFSMAFFHQCWRVVERDVLAFFKEFYQHSKFEKSLNATFIALIPKKNDASNIRDFRPISLVGSLYKILSKVSANRLKQFSILVNGAPVDFFGSTRGLRQGDLLSPMLFLVMMEVFSRMLKRVEGAGLIRGFKADGRRGEGECVSHLLFACDAEVEQILHVWMLLLCFQAVTGLKVNVLKSEMVPIGEVNNVHALAKILGCRIGTLPRTYLGMLLGASHKSLIIWNPILEKIKRKLAGWKKLYLSKGGRLTLLKRKWLWRFGVEETHLWRRVVALKFGEEWGGWSSKLGKGVHRCGLWRSIRKGWEVFSKCIRFEVGVGDRVKFWTDWWCGDLGLHLSFLVVYGITTNREASVASSLERLGIEAPRSWNVRLFKDPNDWELGDVDEFLHTLGSNLPQSEHGDRMRWKLSKKGDFDIRSFYNKLRSPLPIIFPWKGICKVKAPPRISFFGLQLRRKFLQGTFCGVEALILLTGALCVVVMGRR